MPHVNQLVDEFGDRGFVVVGITGESETLTVPYLEATGMKAQVAYVTDPSASMREFGFRGYPSAALIDPRGNVVWKGHPARLNSSIIEGHLKGARTGAASPFELAVELPKKYVSIANRMKKGALGASLVAIEKSLEGSSLEEEHRAPLESARLEIQRVLEAQRQRAEAALTEQRYYDALAVLGDLDEHFSGHPSGDEAATRLGDLKRDKSLRRELEAGKRIAEGLELIAAGKTDKGLAKFAGVFEGPYEDTREAERARRLHEEHAQ